MSTPTSTPKLQLVKDVPPAPTNRQGGDFYVENKDKCPDHNYMGQGWPTSVKDTGNYDDDGQVEIEGCRTCFDIWRKVHINPGTERAGE